MTLQLPNRNAQKKGKKYFRYKLQSRIGSKIDKIFEYWAGLETHSPFYYHKFLFKY